MKRSELPLLVGALTLSLGFGASAATYKIDKITAERDMGYWARGSTPVYGQASCNTQNNGITVCGGPTLPFSSTDPDKAYIVPKISYGIHAYYPARCTLGDKYGNRGALGGTGYVFKNGAGWNVEYVKDTGLAAGDWGQSRDIPDYASNQTMLSTFVPNYVTCDDGLGVFEVIIKSELDARAKDDGGKDNTRRHVRTIKVQYRPDGPITGIQLQPAVLELTGPAGEYVEAKTRLDVDVKYVTTISVDWPAADLVEYENQGKWSKHLVHKLTVVGGKAYRDQKIRLRSATPTSKTISIPVTVTVD